jgi:hypothetical protein
MISTIKFFIKVFVKCLIGFFVLYLPKTVLGGTLSTFGKNLDQNSNELCQVFECYPPGLSKSDACDLLRTSLLKDLKMFVARMDQFILLIGISALRLVKSFQVEIKQVLFDHAKDSEVELNVTSLILHNSRDLYVPNQHNQLWIQSHLVAGI